MAPIPDYVRIAEHITARIRVGDLKAGEKLPTYDQLADDYAVGVSTVGAAMRVLRDRGLVVGRSGKGTYVADRDES